MMRSAPALLMQVSVSKTVSFSLIQPCSAAAFIIAYSPLTWYAATGIAKCCDIGQHVEIRAGGFDH